MKSRIRFFTLTLAFLLIAANGFAAADISFRGPLNTWRDTVKNLNVLFPENFTVYNFVGSSLNDVVVPSDVKEATPLQVNSYSVQGLENLNNWASDTDNTYFKHQYVSTHQKEIRRALQVIHGDFDANPLKDLVVLHDQFVALCYNYTGDSCSNIQYLNPVLITGTKEYSFFPWTGAVADFNGDGHDDIAIAGYSHMFFPYQGHVTVYLGSGDGNQPTLLDTYIVEGGIPLSIAVGNFDGDTKPDIITGNMFVKATCSSSIGGFLHYFKNTGNGFEDGSSTNQQGPDQQFYLSPGECYRPTGLVAYNPDGAGPDDLVMTCYNTLSCDAQNNTGERPGRVFSLKNTANGTNFSVEQALLDPNSVYPYTSTVGDYNQDGKTDVAITDYARHHVITYQGSDPFKFETGTYSEIDTGVYSPKFIQTHSMNEDNLPDLVVSASGLFWPEPKTLNLPPPDNNFPGNILDVLIDVGPGAQLAEPEPIDAQLASGVRSVINLSSYQFLNSAADNPRQIYPASADHQQINYRPRSRDLKLQPRALVDASSVGDREIKTFEGPARTTHGVLVLINMRPAISIDEPNCDVTQIKYRCQAPEGLQLKDCIFESTDPALSATPATPAAPTLSVEKTGTISFPQDQKVHKFTIKSVDQNDKVFTADFTIDLTECPGPSVPGGCTQEFKSVEVWTDNPFQICCPAGTIGLTQTSGPQILLPDGKTFTQKNVAFNGQCISGNLDWDPNTTNWEDDVIDLTCVSQTQEICGKLQIVQKKAMLEGSGRFCALVKGGQVKNSSFALALVFGFSLVLLTGWRYSRTKQKA